jgi:hypothetical protein
MAFGDREQQARNAKMLQERARRKALAREHPRTQPIASSELAPTRARHNRNPPARVPRDAAQAARARSRGLCVVCVFDGKSNQRRGKAVHLHHAFPKQRNRWPHLAKDSRNLVGVCFDCHMAHENASRRIPLEALPACVFVLAVRTGGHALDYLAGPTYAGDLDRVLPVKLAEVTG